MKIYTNTRSAIRPENMKIDEYSVWIAKNIQESEIIGDISTVSYIEYEYDLIQYDKDEYIKMIDNQLTDTQLALCEIYERSL